MFDADAPSSRLALEQIEAPLTKERLFRIARARTASDANADDLVSVALMRVFDPEDAPWDPARTPFLSHMAGVMRQSWDRLRRKMGPKRELLEGDIAEDPVVEGREPAPDEELHRRRSVAIWKALLDEVLVNIGEKDPIAKGVVDLGLRGIDEPSAQARLLACSVRDVELARKKLRYHAGLARAARDAEERIRMQTLREPNKKDEVTP